MCPAVDTPVLTPTLPHCAALPVFIESPAEAFPAPFFLLLYLLSSTV